MPIPSEYTSFHDWFNQYVGNLGATNTDIYCMEKYWPYLTPDQQSALKVIYVQQINTAISGFDAIKTYLLTEV